MDNGAHGAVSGYPQWVVAAHLQQSLITSKNLTFVTNIPSKRFATLRFSSHCKPERIFQNNRERHDSQVFAGQG
jgi:hypothetical protein